LDKVVNTIFELDGDGKITQYSGGYSDYLEKKENPPLKQIPDKPRIKPQKPKTAKISKLKFTFNEKREYDTIENEIADLENQLRLTEDQIEKHYSDYGNLVRFYETKEKLEAELSLKMERWLYLNDLAEKIEANQ
jgi:ATP-binding cassette subfamily F protein uup